MGMIDISPSTLAPLVLRNLLTSIFLFADKSLLNLAEKFKLLELIRYFLITLFLFFLRLLPSLFPSLIPTSDSDPLKPPKTHDFKPSYGGSGVASGELGVSRALSQLLSIVNNVPVSSRKYEVVRSLAEKLIDENHREGFEALREVNRTVLSAAFGRTLGQLEAVMVDQAPGIAHGSDGGSGSGPIDHQVSRVIRAVRSLAVGRTKVGREGLGSSPEKLAAELLWLAQKLAACGFAEESCLRWASATRLASLALSAEPRLQGSLLKVSAFLFKQAKEMGKEEEETEESKKEEERERKMKMLMSWLPLMCRASNGTDAPIMSINERTEIERVMEEMIGMLHQHQQEQVLSLWLHHFTFSPSSDWPNLHSSYDRWYSASRKLLILQ